MSIALESKAPTIHTHSIFNVTGLNNALDGKASTAHSHSNYASTNHNHLIDDTTGLQEALDGKAPTHTHPYASSSHSHSIANVSGLQNALDGKSSTSHTHSYASSSHNHTIANVTGLQTALDGKASTHSHPYAATSHNHSIANVTGLQTALDGKAASSHSHSISNVTNLQTTLDGKALSDHTHEISHIDNLHESLNLKPEYSEFNPVKTDVTTLKTDVTNLTGHTTALKTLTADMTRDGNRLEFYKSGVTTEIRSSAMTIASQGSPDLYGWKFEYDGGKLRLKRNQGGTWYTYMCCLYNSLPIFYKGSTGYSLQSIYDKGVSNTSRITTLEGHDHDSDYAPILGSTNYAIKSIEPIANAAMEKANSNETKITSLEYDNSYWEHFGFFKSHFDDGTNMTSNYMCREIGDVYQGVRAIPYEFNIKRIYLYGYSSAMDTVDNYDNGVKLEVWLKSSQIYGTYYSTSIVKQCNTNDFSCNGHNAVWFINIDATLPSDQPFSMYLRSTVGISWFEATYDIYGFKKPGLFHP
eukprot:TRINITY_DN10782_c0_g2_i6.p1 TRINITY_DN10782_c0_g2~~TRINITY_DN10782_c0_g2_i6.p1  ORF type:complete len:556 (+),score=124.17 TRINITY_DN10782_c0_g2_i6:92-1669(+)